MIDLDILFLVAITGFSFSLMPGSSMMYVLSHSLKYKFKGCFCSSLGLAVGGVLHAFLAAFGVSKIIETKPEILIYLKFIGAFYLLYIAIDIMLEKNIKKGDLKEVEVKDKSLFKIFYQSILVEFLNPHTILFFLAFIPQFAPASDIGNPIFYMLMIGLLIPLTAIPTDIFVVFTGSYLVKKMEGSNFSQNLLKYLSSIILIGLSINLFVSNI